MIFPFIVLDCLQSAFSRKICPFLIPVSATATNDATIRDLDETRIDGHIFSFRACALVCRGSRAWVTRGVPLQRKMIDRRSLYKDCRTPSKTRSFSGGGGGTFTALRSCDLSSKYCSLCNNYLCANVLITNCRS